MWVPRTPCPVVRFEGVGGVAAGKLYQFSGFYTWNPIRAMARCEAFDPATNSWTRLADIPHAITHCGQVVDDQAADDQTFWLAGGFLGDNPGPSTTEVWKYSIKNNWWAAGPPLPDQRAGGALVRLGRELHYFGGVVRANGVYTQDYGTHWALDLDGGSAWRTLTPDGRVLPEMPNPRNHLGGVALNGKIYAIGGQHLGYEANSAQTEVDVYDPVTNAWSIAAPMPRPLGHITADVFVRNSRIVVTAGSSNSVQVANVIEYDPATNSWSELRALPGARESSVAGLVGDQMVVTCGLQGSSPRSQTWVSTPAGILPAPWAESDVGAAGVAGGTTSTNYSSSFSVDGSGYGIASSADSFHYLYQSLSGDGQIVVKVASQENTSPAAQAGVMIRETLDSSSKHAAMLITPSKGVFFQRRLSTGGATSQTVITGSGLAAPYWLKLVRSGNRLTGYHSSTGSTWTQLGYSTITMASKVWIGLAVSSSVNTVLSTADFTNLNFAPKANAGSDQSITSGTSARLDSSGSTDDGLPAGTLKFSWKKISGPGTVTFSNSGGATTNASFSAAGVYTIRLTVSDSKLSGTDDLVVTVK